MTDLQQYYNDPSLQEAQQTSEASATTAAQYQSAASLLPSKLKEAIQGKLNYNKDIIEAKNRAMAEYFKAPSAAREKYQDIWNPFSREKLVTEERAQAYLPFANLTDILGERHGSIADIIDAGTGAFQADVSAKESAAKIDRQSYSDELELAGLLSDAAYREASLANSGSGGGLSAGDTTELRSSLVEDINGGISANIDKETLKTQLAAAYPEFDANEINNMVDAFYPATTTTTSNFNWEYSESQKAMHQKVKDFFKPQTAEKKKAMWDKILGKNKEEAKNKSW